LTASATDQALLCAACAPSRVGVAVAKTWLAHARVLPCGAGTAVYCRGRRTPGLLLLAAGRVNIGSFDAQGVHRRWQTAEAGQWLDLPGALLQAPHLDDAIAEEDARVLVLPRPDVLADPAARAIGWRALATAATAQTHGLQRSLQAMRTLDVPGRLAVWLLAHVSPRRQVVLQQQKRALATELGTTAENLSRCLRLMQAKGIVAVDGYTIHVLDRAALRALAQSR